ncbi:MAG: tetratricopeptide repeat protein [Cyanobacteria bacterium]|nr:tetratricopeptide repeat protein [Cyanobacteriota bacterium]
MMKNIRHLRWTSISALLLALVAIPESAFADQIGSQKTPDADPQQAEAVSEFTKDWQQIQSLADDAMMKLEYGNAERLLKQASVKARAFPPGDIRHSKSAGDLGRLLTIRGRFTEAEPYLEEEFCLRDVSTENANGKLVVPSMGSLIRFYLRYGSAEKAEPLTEELLSYITGKYKTYIEQTQGSLKLKPGQPLVGWAGTVAPVVNDPLVEWAITCDDLGNLYLSRGNLDMADRLFKAALDLKATVLGKKHLSLANSYDSLAGVCQARNQDEDAESYLRDALEITEGILSPDDPKIYSRLDKLAKCLIKEGKKEEAEQLYLKASKLSESDQVATGNTQRALFALGCLYSDRKNYAAAAPVLEHALRMAQEFHGDCSVQTVPYLRKYAYVLYYLGRKGDMENLKARADNISPDVQPLTPQVKMEAGVWSQKVN